jgi:hypothetical protein
MRLPDKDKKQAFDLDTHDKMLAAIAIIEMHITPPLNTTITFFTCFSPFTARSILSENKAQAMAAVISNAENFSIWFLPNFRLPGGRQPTAIAAPARFCRNCQSDAPAARFPKRRGNLPPRSHRP